jgi:methionyl aminopeptidase
MGITLKSPADLAIMREAAVVNNEALQAVRAELRPGVTTAELDKIAFDVIKRHGATPAFLGYPPGSRYPFPATITVSINEELVHGIPGDRVLQDGDIVSIDCGTVYKGFVADAAYTASVGQITEVAQQVIDVTREALRLAIEACQTGNRLGDISNAVQRYVESHKMNVPREYGGHGVGREMHEDPHIPNWGRKGKGVRLKPGMTLALEPMVMLGSAKTKVLNDHWTVVSVDEKISAHFEHSVAITQNGPLVLTDFS